MATSLETGSKQLLLKYLVSKSESLFFYSSLRTFVLRLQHVKQHVKQKQYPFFYP